MACAQQIEIGLKPSADTRRVEASLELDFEFDHAAGRTVLAASRQQAPLQVVRAFALEDGSALAHLHNVSGGLLGGDRLALRAQVGAGASAQLTTTGATRIYFDGLAAAIRSIDPVNGVIVVTPPPGAAGYQATPFSASSSL
jgi:hypothetical protein